MPAAIVAADIDHMPRTVSKFSPMAKPPPSPRQHPSYIRTYTFPLHPNRSQERSLSGIIGTCRTLYNAALEQRIDAYRKQRKSLTRYDQQRDLTVLREEDPDTFGAVAATIERSALIRVDEAYKAFFRRCKSGSKSPGFPRFKGPDRYSSFSFGCVPVIEDDHILVPRLGPIRLNKYRDLPARAVPVDARVRYHAGKHKWTVGIVCLLGELPEKVDPSSLGPSEMVGVDLGLTQYMVLSDGTCVENPRLLREAEASIARCQRELALKSRGSSNYRKKKRELTRKYEDLDNKRKDFHCKLACELVGRYRAIFLEDLSIAEMLDSDSFKPSSTGLRKSISDAGWGQFTKRVQCKAESAGSWVLLVDPTGTTQQCSRCLEHPSIRKTLRDRVHECEHCGLRMDRDLNASHNILARGLRALEATWAKIQVAERGASDVRI